MPTGMWRKTKPRSARRSPPKRRIMTPTSAPIKNRLASSDPVNSPPVAEASGRNVLHAKKTRLTTTVSVKCAATSPMTVFLRALRIGSDTAAIHDDDTAERIIATFRQAQYLRASGFAAEGLNPRLAVRSGSPRATFGCQGACPDRENAVRSKYEVGFERENTQKRRLLKTVPYKKDMLISDGIHTVSHPRSD